MKRIMIFVAMVAGFSSCYKEECHLCITQVTRNGITQPERVEQTYCGLKKKELREKETSFTRYYYDSTLARTVYEDLHTDCY